MNKIYFFYGRIIIMMSVILFSACRKGVIEVTEVTEVTKPLRIVQLCDPQLGFGGFDHDVANLEKAVTLINDLKPDMVLIAGDMVNDHSDEQAIATFKDIIAHIKYPILLTPGNHDIDFTMEGLERYHKYFGDDYGKTECNGYCIISVNSLLWWTKAPQELVECHDNWLINTLQQAKKEEQPIILLAHIPLFISSVDENDDYFNLPKTKRQEIFNLCEDNGVFLYLAGHTHTTFRNEYKGIAFLNGETTSLNFDNCPFGFRLLTIYSPNNFEWEFIAL